MNALVKMIITICVGAFSIVPAFGNDTISGKVIDSVTSLPLCSVLVKIASPACSTLTDSNGKFSFSIPTTAVKNRIVEKVVDSRISWSNNGFSISGSGYSQNARLEIIDCSGKIMNANSYVPNGMYVVRVRDNASVSVLRIIKNGNGSAVVKSTTSSEGKVLAKAAVAAGYNLSFNKAKYNPGEVSVSGSATGLTALLIPAAPTGSICVKVKVMPIGSMTNGQIAFGKMINPNWLIVMIVPPSGIGFVVVDTVRNFTAGQVFTKTYSNLTVGAGYGVGFATQDSTVLNSLVWHDVNQRKGINGVNVSANEIDTVTAPDLQAVCSHFGAKFVPNTNAVKFEVFLQALNSNGSVLPTYIDSLIVPKGTADTMSVTNDIILSAATLSPYITYYNIRLRDYDSYGIVLSEGIADSVAVLPGQNVVYSANMLPVISTSSSLSKKAVLRK
jgi:hypothetical protein